MRVLQIVGDKPVAYEIDRLELIRSLWDKLADLLRVLGVNRDEPAARRREIGSKPQVRPFISNKVVGGVLLVQKLDHLCIRVRQVLVENAIFRVGPL